MTLPAHQVLEGSRAGGELGQASLPDLEGVVVVRVCGEIDLYTGPALRRTLQELLPPPASARPDTPDVGVSGGASGRAADGVRAVVVDLSEVSFADSYALGVLVHGHRLARPGGRAYAVVATLEMIHTLFRVTGLARVMPLHPDVVSAVRSLHPAHGDVHRVVPG
ncbi:STAS domain-containing protein [Quadrisphaera sp. INWT6]|nr:STAS domain-containing protein [Quadrisphaera sp. INWT6]